MWQDSTSPTLGQRARTSTRTVSSSGWPRGRRLVQTAGPPTVARTTGEATNIASRWWTSPPSLGESSTTSLAGLICLSSANRRMVSGRKGDEENTFWLNYWLNKICLNLCWNKTLLITKSYNCENCFYFAFLEKNQQVWC